VAAFVPSCDKVRALLQNFGVQCSITYDTGVLGELIQTFEKEEMVRHD